MWLTGRLTPDLVSGRMIPAEASEATPIVTSSCATDLPKKISRSELQPMVGVYRRKRLSIHPWLADCG